MFYFYILELHLVLNFHFFSYASFPYPIIKVAKCISKKYFFFNFMQMNFRRSWYNYEMKEFFYYFLLINMRQTEALPIKHIFKASCHYLWAKKILKTFFKDWPIWKILINKNDSFIWNVIYNFYCQNQQDAEKKVSQLFDCGNFWNSNAKRSRFFPDLKDDKRNLERIIVFQNLLD